MNRAGPLAHAIPAIGVLLARGLGLDDLYTMRIFFMLIAVACVCAVYLLGRDAFRSRLAGVVTASAFLTFSGFIHYASNGPREKTPMTLFIVGILGFLATWFEADEVNEAAGVTGTLAEQINTALTQPESKRWIATIVGLFGTVIGIIDAFSALGLAGSASLRAVAPPIAEALFATALGLGAAIPAAIFYNHFSHVAREIAARMDDFTLEFLTLAERTFGE